VAKRGYPIGLWHLMGRSEKAFQVGVLNQMYFSWLEKKRFIKDVLPFS